MGKTKKQAPDGFILFKGLLLSLGVYLLGQLLVALLVIKGILAENNMFPVIAVLAVLAAGAGGLFCSRRPIWGTLPSAMACAALFACVLAVIGILCWDTVTWTGHGGALLLCVLSGGLLAGLLGGSRKGKGTHKRKIAVL